MPSTPIRRGLVIRDDTSSTASPTPSSTPSSSSDTMTPTMMKLLIALVVLVMIIIFLVGGLYALRAMKRRNQPTVTRDTEDFGAAYGSEKPANYRRLTIETTHSVPSRAYEKEIFVVGDDRAPDSPVPQIHITLPDEVDHHGRPQSGRVVVVRMGENNAMGLEPLDSPPAYPAVNDSRFRSLDLDRMGGLREKEYGRQ